MKADCKLDSLFCFKNSITCGILILGNTMSRATGVIIFFSILLVLAWTHTDTHTNAIVENSIQKEDKLDFISDLLFSMMLISLFPLMYTTRRRRYTVVLATMLGIGSYFLWFSDTSLWVEHGLDIEEQKAVACVIWIVALAILISRLFKKKERKSFSVLVKREAVRRQKDKCAKCKGKLVDYGHDFDHRNGDRSNNKLSNCQVLCTSCHRKKHIA